MSMQSAAEPQGSGHEQTQYVITRVLINKKDKPVSLAFTGYYFHDGPSAKFSVSHNSV